MRLIEKNSGPKCLTKIAKYEELSNAENRLCKDQVIAQLQLEQGNLCAYCNRIVTAYRIEHYIPQNGPNGDSSLELEYSNFLGVCHGKFNYDDHSQSVAFCESVRGSQELLFDPQNEGHINEVYYTNNGYIRSRSANHDREFEEVLHLNIKEMREARIKAYGDIETIIIDGALDTGIPLNEFHNLTLNNLHNEPIEHQAFIVFKLQANADSFS